MRILASSLLGLGLIYGCGPRTERIQITGSDTMLNLAQAWAETYHTIHPEVSIQVAGGGSGVGIAALESGNVDIANSSREIEPQEVREARKNTGKDPKEFQVGYDALAVYVHKDNPLEQISMDELAEIYGEGGKIVRWSDLGIKNTLCSTDEIVRVSRQSSSGTYLYFREVILGNKREYKQGTMDLNGSKDVVTMVGNNPCAIGYSGMAYKAPPVRWLRVSKKKSTPAVEPSVTAVLDGSYPMSRKLYMYTLGEPAGAVKDYLAWVTSRDGQKIVVDIGYVPLPSSLPDGSSHSSSVPEPRHS
jgi:phosphate transport system substrate-binding protein